MTEGPLGGAAFNNEFGRPALNGYFRTFEAQVDSHNGEELRGYHKPRWSNKTKRPTFLGRSVCAGLWDCGGECLLMITVINRWRGNPHNGSEAPI